MKLTLANFLAFLFGVAVTLLILQLVGVDWNPEEEIVSASCVDEGRFKESDGAVAAEIVGPTEMKRMTDDYATLMTPSAPASGNVPGTLKKSAFISKTVTDAIFSNARFANGIVCHFGWDDAEGMQIIVTPGVQEAIVLPPDRGANSFLIKSYCPIKCVNIRDPRTGAEITTGD